MYEYIHYGKKQFILASMLLKLANQSMRTDLKISQLHHLLEVLQPPLPIERGQTNCYQVHLSQYLPTSRPEDAGCRLPGPNHPRSVFFAPKDEALSR